MLHVRAQTPGFIGRERRHLPRAGAARRACGLWRGLCQGMFSVYLRRSLGAIGGRRGHADALAGPGPWSRLGPLWRPDSSKGRPGARGRPWPSGATLRPRGTPPSFGIPEGSEGFHGWAAVPAGAPGTPGSSPRGTRGAGGRRPPAAPHCCRARSG